MACNQELDSVIGTKCRDLLLVTEKGQIQPTLLSQKKTKPVRPTSLRMKKSLWLGLEYFFREIFFPLAKRKR